MYPTDLKYAKSHEWIRIDGDDAVIGISAFAAGKLGDIVFVELPSTDTPLVAGESLGTIESVKAVSDIYSPVSGVVVEINSALEDAPETVNDSPYGDGWLVKVKLDGDIPVDLMDAKAYEEHCSTEE